VSDTNVASVLIIEDEPDLNAAMVDYLALSGFRCDGVRSRHDAVNRLHDGKYDLVVLDLGLPDGDGLVLAEELERAHDSGVVIVTARHTVEEKLKGYGAGADYYLVKPVDMRELVAVLNILLDRRQAARAESLTVPAAAAAETSACGVDTIGWRLHPPACPSLLLTRSEILVVAALAERPGEAVHRDDLVRRLNEDPLRYDPRRMEVLVRRLRRKIADHVGHTDPIKTVHGKGYAFAAPVRILNVPA
jgi:DNA-binding response OmpR family regulator